MAWSKVVLTCVVLASTTVFGQRNPYGKIEAESFDFNSGTQLVESSTASNSKYVGYIHPGDVIGFERLNISAETIAVQLRVACLHDSDPGRVAFIRLDTADAPPLVSYTVESTGSWNRRITSTILIPFPKQPRGVHNLYFTFKYKVPDEGVIDLDWFTFVSLDSLQPPPMVECPTQPVIECPTTPPVIECPTTPLAIECPTTPPAMECPTTVTATSPIPLMDSISTIVYNTTSMAVFNESTSTESYSSLTESNSTSTEINSTSTEINSTSTEIKNAAKSHFISPFYLIYISVIVIQFLIVNF